MSDRRQSSESRARSETTGHEWDGIEELNNPLPRWWLWTFYATIVWALVYTMPVPGLAADHRGDAGGAGLLDPGQRGRPRSTASTAANAPIQAQLVAADLTTIRDDPELLQFATAAGAAVFRTNCSQCHGSGAAGVQAQGLSEPAGR